MIEHPRRTAGISNDVSIALLESELAYDAVMMWVFL